MSVLHYKTSSSVCRMCVAFLVIFNLFTLCYSQSCRSFDSEEGRCITIKRCPSALNLIKDGLEGDNVRRLQRITCGFSGEDPKVCCPLDDIQSEGQDQIRNQQINSLTGHRSFRLLPLLSECGDRKVKFTNRIIGGKVPDLGAFPWLVRIGYRANAQDPVEFYCGGSILNKRYIITAAHCAVASDAELQPIMVRLGEHNTITNPDCSEASGCSHVKDLLIERIIPHPDYVPERKQNDIALLRLNRDINFSTFVQPVCLPMVKEYSIRSFPNLGKDSAATSKRAIVAGWGRTRYDRMGESENLQYVTVPIVQNQQCREIYIGKTTIATSQLCAGGNAGEDSCDGDSGGPLIMPIEGEDSEKFFQIAVVSFGPTKCGSKDLPGIYTRVTEYVKWILDTIEP